MPLRPRSRLTLILALALAAAPAAAERIEEFRQVANDWLLSGRGLPRDYRVELMRMDSADRLQAIAYLRRIGLLTDRPWTLDDLLRPAVTRTEPEE